MARGAKDCTQLGRMVIESIKEDRYCKCELTTTPQFVPLENGKATHSLRDALHIPHGNGTVVTLEIVSTQRMPRFDSIVRDLPWHFALRDILAERSPTKALLKNLNRPEDKPERIAYQRPDGELVCDLTFPVQGYEHAEAHLTIWRSPEPFTDASERFRRSGILIKGSRAIHACTLLTPEFERDPLAKRYFGRLECPWIDKLLHDYDDRREEGQPHAPDNPSLLIDPNRQEGLIPDHPFTKALFLVPSEQLRGLIAKDREAQRDKKKEIESESTTARLSRLAKKAAEFLKQQLDDLQELTEGEDVDRSAFAKQGVLLFPTYLNVAVGQERTLTFYVKSSLVNGVGRVSVEVDDPALTVFDAPFELRPHKRFDDRLMGTFRVRGEQIKDSVYIRASFEHLQSGAVASVIETTIEEHSFQNPLEFDHDEYRVREGSRKTLDLFAKYPEVVSETTTVSVQSSDSIGVPIRGTCQLVPVVGSNYARGALVVQGRKLNAKSDIVASVNGRTAATYVRVVQSPPETTIPIKIELRDEDYGNFRARWADHEGKPHLLLVSARHKSLARYLGPAPAYQGQELPLFRVLLAEIVAESVCRKSLILESKERTWEFRWADLKEDYLIADDVLAKLQQRVRDFVADAHSIMLSDAEMKKHSELSRLNK